MTELDEVAKTYNVSFLDQKHSFDIKPNEVNTKNIGLIFYPGALVDSRAYAPKLAGIASLGVSVFIVKPYLRLANLSTSAADQIIKDNPNVRTWYVGGHSMGGSVSCHFSKANQSAVAGLILFAAYCSDRDKVLAQPTLAVVGTNDPLEPLSKVQNHIPSQTLIKQIKGANHASFGNYGKQPLDGKQEIDDTQMEQTLTKILSDFIK